MVLVHTIDDEFPVQGAELGTLFADYGVESHTQLVPNAVVPSNRNFYAIKLDNSANYESFATDLENTALFDKVELLYNAETIQSACEDVSTCANPVMTNDPASPENDYLETMNLPCAWSITTGNP